MQEEHTTNSSFTSTRSSRRTSINSVSEERESTIIVQRYRLCKKTRQCEKIERCTPKKMGKPLINKSQVKRIKRLDGHWTPIEEEKYQKFVLEMRYKHPTWSEICSHKKRFNYFLEMSKAIKTRTPAQCRSHDQKMRRRYTKDEDNSDNDTETDTETDEDEEMKREFEEKMEEESPVLIKRSVRLRKAVNYKEPEDNDDFEEKKEPKKKGLVEKEQAIKTETVQTEKKKDEINDLLQALGKISTFKTEVMRSGSNKAAKENSKEVVKQEEVLKNDDGNEDISMIAVAVGVLRRRMINLVGKMELEIV